jgi:hypothetical protein
MNKIIKNTRSGFYYVDRRGFTGRLDEATQFASYEDAADARECAASMGVPERDTIIENAPVAAQAIESKLQQNPDGSSYTVFYTRKKDVQYDGSVRANRNNPSPRRFRTEKEAHHHAARFVKIEKHVGYRVEKTYSPVNAFVNVVTGKTNPLIGRKRVGRD